MLPRRFTIALASAALIGFESEAHAIELKALVAKAAPSVVRVEVEGSHGRQTGTGFFVSTDGRVLTNHHVIDGGRSGQVTLAGGKRTGIEGVLAWDEDLDLALLKVAGAGYPHLTLATKAAEPGDEVVVIGNPLGLSTAISSGLVSAVRGAGIAEEDIPVKLPAWALQITAPISPGSSGSPLIAADGTVMGVAVGTFIYGQNVNFGVLAGSAGELVRRAEGRDVVPLAEMGREHLGRNLAISAAVITAFVAAIWLYGRKLQRDEARVPERP